MKGPITKRRLRKKSLITSGRYKKTVLKNGLTVLTETVPGLTSVAMGVFVKAGTRHESSREAGLSHFLEHMVFKGTEKRTPLDIVREVEQVGGEFNAFTAREYTAFHLLLLDQDLDLGMDILADVLMNPTFDASELEKERRVILQELAMVEECPDELIYDLYFELSFGRHGLGRPILGNASSIRRFKKTDLLRYFRKHYRPEHLIVAVAGNVTHAQVKRALKPLAKKTWPGRTPGRKKEAHGFAPAINPRTGNWWVVRPTEQVHLLWAVEGPSYRSRDRLAALLLNIYLGGGMSSALFQEIRENRGLAYTVDASFFPFHDIGSFSIYAATSMNQVPTCVKVIEETVDRMRHELLPEEELQAIKDSLRGTLYLAAESTETRMSNLAMNEMFHGRQLSVEEVCKRFEDVTAADIRRVARKLMGKGRRTILALGPKPSKSVRNRLSPKILKR